MYHNCIPISLEAVRYSYWRNDTRIVRSFQYGNVVTAPLSVLLSRLVVIITSCGTIQPECALTFTMQYRERLYNLSTYLSNMHTRREI